MGFAPFGTEALVCESYFGTGTLFCLCELVEDGDDEGGVKTGENCGRTGVEVSTSPEWPLVSISVTRPGGVDEPLRRAGERNIGGRGVSAACAAIRRKLQEENKRKAGTESQRANSDIGPFCPFFGSQPLLAARAAKAGNSRHAAMHVVERPKKYLKIENN